MAERRQPQVEEAWPHVRLGVDAYDSAVPLQVGHCMARLEVEQHHCIPDMEVFHPVLVVVAEEPAAVKLADDHSGLFPVADHVHRKAAVLLEIVQGGDDHLDRWRHCAFVDRQRARARRLEFATRLG